MRKKSDSVLVLVGSSVTGGRVEEVASAAVVAAVILDGEVVGAAVEELVGDRVDPALVEEVV
jgi:hypothetical protein